MTVEQKTTGRGFALWEIPNRDYRGEPERIVEVQESSLASEPKVWVGYGGSHRMHLSAEAATGVRDALTAWLQEQGIEPREDT